MTRKLLHAVAGAALVLTLVGCANEGPYPAGGTLAYDYAYSGPWDGFYGGYWGSGFYDGGGHYHERHGWHGGQGWHGGMSRLAARTATALPVAPTATAVAAARDGRSHHEIQI